MKTHQILIIGAGSIAKDIADLVADTPQYEVVGFVVDQPPFERGSTLIGKPIYWIDELEDFKPGFQAICALARMHKSEIISKVKHHGIKFIPFIHPSARVSKTASIGEGVVINSGVQIAASASIHDFAIINRGALIGHDTVIGEYSVLSPGVNIAGNVIIGKRTFVGLGANILESLTIGDQSFIGAGSLVTKDVPNRVKVVGMPARIIEKDIEQF